MANDHWRERSEVSKTYVRMYMSTETVKDAKNLRPRALYVYRDLLIYVCSRIFGCKGLCQLYNSNGPYVQSNASLQHCREWSCVVPRTSTPAASSMKSASHTHTHFITPYGMYSDVLQYIYTNTLEYVSGSFQSISSTVRVSFLVHK